MTSDSVRLEDGDIREMERMANEQQQFFSNFSDDKNMIDD